MWNTLIIISAAIAFAALFAWATIGMSRQAQKDWAWFHDISKRATDLPSDVTRKEIEELHKELVEKGRKINNSLIHPQLRAVDGYLRGLYKNAK